MQSVKEFRKNFDKVYYNEIMKLFEPIEQRRRKVFTDACLCAIAAVILLFILPHMYKFVEKICGEDLTSYIMAIPILADIVLFVNPPFFAKEFENSVKKELMPIFLKSLPSFIWSEKQSIPDKFIKNSKLFGNYNRIYGDESFEGIYKNVKIKIWETRLEEDCWKVGDKYIRSTEKFKGVIVALLPERKYKGLTLIKKDNLIDFVPEGLQQVNLEDVEFEKEYNVYSDDQIEARYVLTTAFMERFKNIKLAFNASKIEASISKQGILLGISTGRDLFKVAKLYKPVSDYEQFKTMIDEFASILELIDELKLEQNIGL